MQSVAISLPDYNTIEYAPVELPKCIFWCDLDLIRTKKHEFPIFVRAYAVHVCYITIITNQCTLLRSGMIVIAILFTIKMEDDRVLNATAISACIYIAQMTTLSNFNSHGCHDRPQNSLRFDTCTITFRLRQRL